MSASVTPPEKGLNLLGSLLIIGGAVLLILLSVIVVWPDFEAEVAGRLLPGVEPIDSLECPIMLNGDEDATIQAAFTNPSDKVLRVRIDSAISEGSLLLTRNDPREVFIEPNATEIVEWVVSADDAVLDRMIIARFHLLRNNEMEARAANCGVMVLNLPLLNGSQLVMVLVVGALLCIGLGLKMILSERPLTQRGKRILFQLCLLIVAITIPLTAGLMGFGLVALPLAAIPVLVIVSLVEFALN